MNQPDEDFLKEVNMCLQQTMSIMKLQSLQLRISQVVVGYLCELNNINNIPCKEVDKNVIDTYHKVMNSKSFEYAEASYQSLQDACAKRMGFEDYESFEEAASNVIKNGQSVHEFFKQISDKVKENNNE